MSEIKVNLEVIRATSLTISSYVYLYCLYHNIEIVDILKRSGEEQDLEVLGYLKCNEEGVPVLRNKALILFETSTPETNFYRFWSMYPSKVPNGSGGYRVLRSKDTNSKQANDLKVKYLKLVKTPGLHDKIIVGLNNYLKSLRPTLQYCVGIEVFVNQQLWEKYYDLEDTGEKLSEDRL